jgi:hypothetical protein
MAIHSVPPGVGDRSARVWSLVARLALLPAFVGCASTPTSVELHPLDDAHGPRAVAVIAAREALKTHLLTFARGNVEGVTKVVKTGAGGAALGATAAAQAIVPEEQALAIEQIAASALVQLRLPELTATAVATGVKGLAARDASVIDDGGGSRLGSYRSLRERGFGTAIEIRTTEIGFAGAGADTIMALFMTAEARLVDTANAKPIAMRGLVYISPHHRLGLWAQDGAALAKTEIERAYRTVAERIVDTLVLRPGSGKAPSNAGNPYWLGSEPPGATCGIVPRSPKVEWAGGFVTPNRPTASTVESVLPMLAWEARPAAGEDSAAALRSGAKAENAVYDPRIWKEVDEAPGPLVYERKDLPRPQNQVEAALDPGSTYFWSVRLRYRVDGRPRATLWGAANVPRFHMGKPLQDALFYSRAEGGTLKCVACAADQTTSRPADASTSCQPGTCSGSGHPEVTRSGALSPSWNTFGIRFCHRSFRQRTSKGHADTGRAAGIVARDGRRPISGDPRCIVPATHVDNKLNCSFAGPDLTRSPPWLQSGA